MTVNPTSDPTRDPTNSPSSDPTQDPTNDPSIDPTADPSADPSYDPTDFPSSIPTVSPSITTMPPTSAPTTAPTEAPSASGSPTPPPTYTNNQVFVRNNGCDYGYCSSTSIHNACSNVTTSCQSVEYGWDCFHGIGGSSNMDECKQAGLHGNGVFDLGDGIWDIPYNLNYDNNDIIIRGQGPSTTLRYTGGESTWIQCRWYKCWISLQDLTISSDRTSTNDIQLYMFNGGTLHFQNVIFDGNNYIENQYGPYWIFNESRVNVIFEDCYFVNNHANYVFSSGSTATFSGCIFSANHIQFLVNGSIIKFDNCIFNGSAVDDLLLFTIQQPSTIFVMGSSFDIASQSLLFDLQSIGNNIYLTNTTFQDINGTNDDISSYFTFANDSVSSITQIFIDPCTEYQLPSLDSSSITFSNITNAQNKVFSSPGSSIDETVKCHDNTTTCSITCDEFGSCFLALFDIYTQQTIILCTEIFSCGGAKLSTNFDSQSVNESLRIVCDAESSCSDISIQISSVMMISIDCISYRACFEATISITDSIQATITCHELSLRTSDELYHV